MRAPNPFLFIVGCPRSGTTMLRRIINAHPQIAITPETHWISRYLREGEGLTPEGFVTKEFISKLLGYRRFRRMRLTRSELESLLQNRKISYAEFVTGVFDLYGKAHSKIFVGDKTPSYSSSIDVLHSLWPDAKFIHLIRDGRDVALSLLHWRKKEKVMGRFPKSWENNPLATAAFFWKWRVRLATELGQALPPDLYIETKYETLVTNPADECKRLCDFIGFPFDSAMLRFYEGRSRAQKGLTANSAWMPITAGLRDWKTQMTEGDVELFEAASGDLLVELGYFRRFPNPSGEKLNEASAIHASFSRDVRDRVLPAKW